MRHIPSFALLRTFEAAARLTNFSLAAAELALTPSAVSHQVKALEEHFNRALFTRYKRRVSLTREGQRLLISLAGVMDALETACNDIRLPSTEQVLTVHSSPSFASKWLTPRLPDFLARYPDITLRLSSGAEPIDLTETLYIEVAISYGCPVQRAGLDVVALGSEHIAPMCSPRMLRADVTPAQTLLSAPLIDSPLSQVSWADWFALNHLQLPTRRRPSFDRAALAIAAAVDGIGITLESKRLAERELHSRELVIVGDGLFVPIERETHFLSQRSSERASRKLSAFRCWLLNTLGLACQQQY